MTPENRADLVRRLDVLEEGRGKGAVAAGAVFGGAAGLRRIGDDHAERRIDLGEPARDAADAPGACRVSKRIGERIVAAGIEHEHAQVLGLLQIGEDIVDLREPAQIGFVGELGVDRHQVVDAADTASRGRCNRTARHPHRARRARTARHCRPCPPGRDRGRGWSRSRPA